MDTNARLGLVTGSNSISADRFDLEPVDVEVACGQGRTETETCAVTVLVGDGLAVLPRHGLRAHVPAHEIDHAANLRALLAVGVDRIVAIGSSGSLRTDWPVGTVVAPDDVFAPWSNPIWFHDTRAHISPRFDVDWRGSVIAAWRAATDVAMVDGGTYVQTRGPRFESRAEVRFYATVADLVGMTLVDEALLAQQAGLRYAAICPIDNVANGLDTDPLTLDSFKAGVASNATHLEQTVTRVLQALTRRSSTEPAAEVSAGGSLR